jgi:hypothetical protein
MHVLVGSLLFIIVSGPRAQAQTTQDIFPVPVKFLPIPISGELSMIPMSLFPY